MAKTETADLDTLRPTQLTLGFYQVHEKMDVSGQPREPAAMRKFLRDHCIRTIAGPGGALYIADHHHWARAWLELGWRTAPVRIDTDLSDLSPGAFWKKMRALGHVHPVDEHGKYLDVDALPATVMGMRASGMARVIARANPAMLCMSSSTWRRKNPAQLKSP